MTTPEIIKSRKYRFKGSHESVEYTALTEFVDRNYLAAFVDRHDYLHTIDVGRLELVPLDEDKFMTFGQLTALLSPNTFSYTVRFENPDGTGDTVVKAFLDHDLRRVVITQ